MNLVNGVLLVDKPTGMTSHDVVGRLRRLLGIRAIGHAGTLDPLATGLLVVLVGEATKISDYVLNEEKGYQVEFQFGYETETWDTEGLRLESSIVQSGCMDPKNLPWKSVAEGLVGPLDLPIPAYSAKKINGTKLYDLARSGKSFDLPLRTMTFSHLELLEGDEASVRFKCSKGSFVRSWVYQLGKLLEVGATMSGLRRTWSSPFSVEQALSLEEIERLWLARSERAGTVFGPAWVEMSRAVPGAHRLILNTRDQRLASNGQIPNALVEELNELSQTVKWVSLISESSQDLIAILGRETSGEFRIRRGFRVT